MDLKTKNILITGPPGIGKTTLIRKVFDALKQHPGAGFYTAEIRENGIRKGFELIGLDGREELLSHVDIKDGFRVGKYGVDVAGFEDFLDIIPFLKPAIRFIIIDEIGKMECFSDKFKKLLKDILESEKLVVASIAIKGGGLIAEIKKRDDIKLFEVTKNNRNTLLPEILKQTTS